MSKHWVSDWPSLNDWNAALLRLAAWVALGALIFNGVAFSAHRHAMHSVPVISSVDVLHVATSDEGACALCSAAAMLEPYLPPSATILVVLRGSDAQAITSAARDDPVSSRAHIWRSRAPPASAPT